MNISQAFRMSLKAIMGNKVRSILTMLGVVIGVAAVITLVSLVQGMNYMSMEYYRQMGQNKITVYSWSGRDMTTTIREFTQDYPDLVIGMSPESSYGARSIKYQAKSAEYTNVRYGSEQFSICNNYTVVRGRDLSYMDIKLRNRVVVLGAAMADDLFNFQNPIGHSIQIDGNEFTVIGVYERKFDASQGMDYYDQLAVVPYTLNRLLSKNVTIENYTLRGKDTESTLGAIEKLRTVLMAKYPSGQFDVYSQDQWMGDNEEYTNMLSLVLGGIAGISLLVGGIGIMNIMLVTVTERTREIGIRKAIGAERRAIIFQFLIEAAVVSAFGGLIGLAIGSLATIVLSKVLMQSIFYPSMGIALGSVVFSLALGVIFGLYPAAKASKLQPVDALRTD